MSVGEVVDVIAAKLQEATMQGNRRPYGTGMLVAGFLPSDMEGPREALYKGMCEGGNDSPSPVLYRIEPSGAYTMWKACAIGRVSKPFPSPRSCKRNYLMRTPVCHCLTSQA
jgi:20S proteasome alpha/beta subunit